jgi:ABC-type bacteriocin/lantibiotic exporter with double-glycine peptidase domain
MLTTYRQLFAILDRAERRQVYGLLVFSSLMALIDLVGVAAVLPFLAVAADPGIVLENAVLAEVYAWSGVSSDREFLILLGGLVLAFILAGMVVKLFGQYRIIRFSHSRNHSFSRRLLAHYLAQPYAWHLSQNSAGLGAAILSDCDRVVSSALLPALRALAQIASLLFLIGFLIMISPGVALSSALGLCATYTLIFFFVRRQLARLGERQIQANADRYRVAQEAFGGIKEVKLMGLEARYSDRYEDPVHKYVEAIAMSQIISELPRFLLEAIAFGGLVLIILGLLILQEARLADVLPTLGVFGFAVLKIFPSIQQIYHAFSQMRFATPVLAKLHAELLDASNVENSDQTFAAPLLLSCHLSLEDIHFVYPAAGRAALAGLSLLIKANTTVGIVGGTGAGKTTAVDLILGLLTPNKGRIVVDEAPLGPDSMRAWQNAIGYVPQQIFLTDDSVAANIAFGLPPEARDMAAVERAARLAELHDFVIRDLPQGYNTAVGERGVRLSGGQRQRIGIARALYHDPSVLILDEATSALDNLTERAVMDAVANLAHAKTIIMIAHRLTTVRACDTIFLMENGKLVAQGTFDELIEDSETFRRMAL